MKENNRPVDVDALMEKAFRLPPPPMPDFFAEAAPKSPIELSLEDLDTLAAAGKTMRPGEIEELHDGDSLPGLGKNRRKKF